MRKTKIVVTLGPAIQDLEMMKKLFLAGANIVRLNFSHGNHAEHLVRINMARQAAKELGLRIPIMLDNKGPEIRIGTFAKQKISLQQGDRFCLTTRAVIGDQTMVTVEYEAMPREVTAGSMILLDDGNLSMRVIEVQNGSDIICEVLNSGELSDRKKVNLPGAKISIPAVNPKDVEDILFGIEHNLDFVAASFIRKAEDVLEIRRIIEDAGGNMKIIAKIESQEGLDNLSDILKVTDALMVARGDLGVEVPSEQVPIAQKEMIRLCNQKAIPVITATQMLDSMIRNPRPTRAEASDIANAILDGTDAIMLSGETASGKYPLESVQTMARIAEKTESAWPMKLNWQNNRLTTEVSVTDAISHAVCQSANDLKADAIITATSSGSTARNVAKYRPQARIIAVTSHEATANQLCLVWGITPLVVPNMPDTDSMVNEAVGTALDAECIANGDLIILTAGVPVGIPGSTNMMQIVTVGDILVRGVCIGECNVVGRAVVAFSPEEAEAKMHQGDILITKSVDGDYLPAIKKAAALVTEEGGLSSSGAIFGLNLNILAMVGAENATSFIKTGQEITVDRYGRIFRGKVRA
ncbi:MAG: pyruvate kinase [Negativicutes bacterium]|nr:pyruvate kinase [Negativicutes bacterium]